MNDKILAGMTFFLVFGFIANLIAFIFGFSSDRTGFFIGIFEVVLLMDVIALIPVYLNRVLNNDELSGNRKLLWSFGLVIVSVVAMPNYYFRYVMADRSR